MKTVLVWILKAYRAVISPMYGQVCRYYPSCSAYALEAVHVHGAARGSWLAVRRLVRCHPWTPGGYDPVPRLDGQPAEATELDSPGVSSDRLDDDPHGGRFVDTVDGGSFVDTVDKGSPISSSSTPATSRGARA